MIIRVYREPQTGDWITTIPIDWWDGFQSFAREIRLNFVKQRTSANGVTIRISEGLRKQDIEEHLGLYFDGIAAVEVIVPKEMR
jgi:hypothetical protein